MHRGNPEARLLFIMFVGKSGFSKNCPLVKCNYIGPQICFWITFVSIDQLYSNFTYAHIHPSLREDPN